MKKHQSTINWKIYDDVQDLSWGVRLYQLPKQLQNAIRKSARLTSDNEEYDALYIAPSLLIQAGERGKPIPSVFVGGRFFQKGEVITVYEGRLVKRGTRAALMSDHVIDAYGHPGKVMVGITSRSNRRKLGNVGAGSLINDATVNLAESMRHSRLLGRTTVVHREGAFGRPNVEFMALVLENEYERMRDGSSDDMPSVVIAAVALVSLNEGSELSVSYGNSYWRSFVEHQLELEREREESMSSSSDTQLVIDATTERMRRLKVAAGI